MTIVVHIASFPDFSVLILVLLYDLADLKYLGADICYFLVLMLYYPTPGLSEERYSTSWR